MDNSVTRNPTNMIETTHRVLIVEDEPLIALDLEATVEALGLEVAGLAAGREQALQLAPIADIAFVDVNLADGPTGPDIGRSLIEDYGVTVVFMTGNPEAVIHQLNGALGVVTKPVMPSIVEQSLRRAMEARSGLV